MTRGEKLKLLSRIREDVNACYAPIIDLVAMTADPGPDVDSLAQCVSGEVNVIAKHVREIACSLEECVQEIAKGSDPGAARDRNRETAQHAIECIDRVHIALAKASASLLAPNDHAMLEDAILEALAAASDARADVCLLAAIDTAAASLA